MEELSKTIVKLLEENDEIVLKDVHLNVEHLELAEEGVISLDSKKKKKKK